MADELNATEARAREAVARFEEAIDRQWDAVTVPAWPHAPKHIREAYGDPSVPEPRSAEALDAWLTWLERRTGSLAQCLENLERGRIATSNDPARAELYWKRALITSERALAELDGTSSPYRPDSFRRHADRV